MITNRLEAVDKCKEKGQKVCVVLGVLGRQGSE